MEPQVDFQRVGNEWKISGMSGVSGVGRLDPRYFEPEITTRTMMTAAAGNDVSEFQACIDPKGELGSAATDEAVARTLMERLNLQGFALNACDAAGPNRLLYSVQVPLRSSEERWQGPFSGMRNAEFSLHPDGWKLANVE